MKAADVTRFPHWAFVAGGESFSDSRVGEDGSVLIRRVRSGASDEPAVVVDEVRKSLD